MAWTAPALGSEFAVSEIVTAAKMNAKITDNLRYLKGLDGAVVITDSLQVEKAAADSQFYISSVSPRLAMGNNATYTSRTLSTRWVMATSPGDFGLGLGDSQIFTEGINGGTAGRLVLGANSSLTQLVLATNGNIGMGAAVPQGRVHASNGAGGGMVYLSGVVSGTLNTIAVAGTVTRAASFWITDYNNGTVAFLTQLPFLTVALGASTTYVNGDTITVAVTAGGAITFQRTAGTQNHNVNVIALYI